MLLAESFLTLANSTRILSKFSMFYWIHLICVTCHRATSSVLAILRYFHQIVKSQSGYRSIVRQNAFNFFYLIVVKTEAML